MTTSQHGKPPRTFRSVSVWDLRCCGCERQLEIPVQTPSLRILRCPFCGTVLRIYWRPEAA